MFQATQARFLSLLEAFKAKLPEEPAAEAAAEAATEAEAAPEAEATASRRRAPEASSRDRGRDARGRSSTGGRSSTETEADQNEEGPRRRREGVTVAKSKIGTEDLLEQFKEMTLLELSEFIKAFEEAFDVQAAAAAPMMVAGAPAAGAAASGGRGGAVGVRRHPHGCRRQEDPGDQGGPGAHEPRSQGSEGPRRRRAEAGPREGDQGGGRQGQGAARGRRRDRRDQVVRIEQPGADREAAPRVPLPATLVLACAHVR